jgi:hypothetical protein
MYSYVIEFNLSQRGEDAEDYLADAVRKWPRLWGDIPGVTDTLLLSSAFALGGEFDYQWRVEIESLATVSRIDEVMKAGEGGWRAARRDWFQARTAARASVYRHLDGDQDYCADRSGAEAPIHLVFHSEPERLERPGDHLDAIRPIAGVVSTHVLRPVLGSSGTSDQTWVRLASLDHLDGVSQVDLRVRSGRLFGELREVDGSLFSGA